MKTFQIQNVTIDEMESMATDLQQKIAAFTQQHEEYSKIVITFQVDPEQDIEKEIQRGKKALEELKRKEIERTKLVKAEEDIIEAINDLRQMMKFYRYQTEKRTYQMKQSHDEQIDEFISSANEDESLQGQFETLKNELLQLKYLSSSNGKTVKIDEEDIKTTFTEEQMNKIREWTGLDFGYYVFDNRTDPHDSTDSVFIDKMIGKSKVLICMSGFHGEIIGGYVDALIWRKKKWIEDNKAFIFRFYQDKVEKYDVKEPQFAFALNEKEFRGLCGFGKGYDLLIPKKNRRIETVPGSYLEKPIQMCGLLRRVTVIQMV